jgi:hypothetical protein
MSRHSTSLSDPERQLGSYSSVDDLETSISDYLAQHNKTPTRFRWTKTAEDILARERRALNVLDETRGNR